MADQVSETPITPIDIADGSVALRERDASGKLVPKPAGEAHEGGCVCGAIRYRTTGAPAAGIVCHCKWCQKRLASAFAVIAYFNDDQVTFTQGDVREFESRSDESGRWLRVGFCPACGTTVTHTAEVRPNMRAIAAGTFDDPDWFRIDRHIWTVSKRPWVQMPQDVAVYEKGSVGATPIRPPRDAD